MKKGTVKNSSLSLLDEFLPAFGAGDGDLSLSPGYPYLLVAAGAVIVAVILVLQLLPKQKELAVFFVALIYISGQAAYDGQDHENIGNGGQQQLETGEGQQHGKEGTGQTNTQNRHIKLISTVTAHHKVTQTRTEFIAQAAQPISKSVHKMLPWHDSFLYYSQNRKKFNLKSI